MRALTRVAPVLSAILLALPAAAQEPPAGGTPPSEEKAPPAEEKAPPAEEKAPPPAEPPPAEEKAPPVEEKPAPPEDESDDLLEDSDEGWGDEEKEPSYPRFENHGYFRFRADMFSHVDLGTFFRNGSTQGTSGFKPPLTENVVNNTAGGAAFDPADVGAGNDENIIAGANLRLRWQPSILISESLKIAATFDILDNLVMGSTPDFNPGRPDAPFSAFAMSQAPPSDDFQIEDSVRVKELWGEWKILGIPLRFGRMASHWGLGMVANGGNEWDDDFGDYIDRVMAAIRVYGIYIAGGYDIVSSGPLYAEAFQPFGQPYDATNSDDVQQGWIAIFQRPIQPEEVEDRLKLLVKDRKPAFDWGLYTIFRTQDLDLTSGSWTDYKKTLEEGQPPDYDQLQLIKRDAWAVVPDLWLRFEFRPTYTLKVHAELEAALIYAEIGTVLDGEADEERKILSWGVALQADVTTGGLTIGLDGGAASGDDAEFLGFLDRTNFEEGGAKNLEITNFKFDRNYHVDQILFREVIGGVTNAWYVKPYVKYDLFDSPDGAIGGRLDVLLAGAMNKKAYPGDAPWLGTELDAKIFVEDESRFYGDVTFGILFPGEAFKLKPGPPTETGGFQPGFLGYTGPPKDPEIAWTLQAHLVLRY